MDFKKGTKNFINYICSDMQGKDGLICTIDSCDEMGYFMKDKGIDKRIEIKMLKEYGIKVRAVYLLGEQGYLLKVNKIKEPHHKELIFKNRTNTRVF